ncbi:MFS transporter [Amycolatopsis silviterrae]|uniref:MFS transporter n=1 Tax=Amycolatopsis silviterrae TaxID=1656914 RepID=A0ABW5HND2_9PSEU
MRQGFRFGSADFVRLWASGTVSFFGTAVSTVALPLVALSVLGASTFEAGVISAAGLVAWLLLGLVAGARIERVRRRPLLIGCDVVRAVALVTIPVAYVLGILSIAQLVVVALVVGVGSVFFDIAVQTYLPSVVSRDELVAGNSRLQVSENAAKTGGPAVGGALVSAIGAPVTILVDVVSYVFSALCLVLVRKREEPPEQTPPRPVGARVREGLHAVLGDPVLRPLTMVAASLNFLGAGFDTLLVPYLLRGLELTPALIGVLVALGGVGGVLGSALGPAIARRFGDARAMVVTALVGPLLSLLVPAAFGGAGLVLFAVGLIGREVCIAVYSLLARSYRQLTTPAGLLARVTASIKFLSWGVLPLGALAGGLLGQVLGNRAGMWAICLALLLTPLPLVLSGLLRKRDLGEPAPITE